jgi:uncharacterized protein involved in exopolysaccharide biosynthesis
MDRRSGIDRFGSPQGGEVSLMGLLRIVHKWRKLVLTLVIALPVLTAVVVLFMPNVYTARGTILLEVSEVDMANELFGQLSALTGLSSQAPSTDIYLAILKSRTVGEAVAGSLNLSDHYRVTAPSTEQQMEKTLAELRKRSKFNSPEPVTIHVRVTDPSPQMAADVVNAYLDQLAEANQTMALSRARRTRRLVEGALDKTMEQLDSLRTEVRDFQKEHGVFSLDEQTTATLELIALLQGELLTLQTRRDALAGFRQETSAELRNLDLQIDASRSRIRDLVEGFSTSTPEGLRADPSEDQSDFVLPLSRVPDLAEQYAQMVMNQKVLEAKYNVLATRLEQTKIEESQSLPTFEILDRAVRPFRKSGPNRKLYVIGAFLAALLAGILLAALFEDISRRLDDSTREELGSMLPSFLRRRIQREPSPHAEAVEGGD